MARCIVCRSAGAIAAEREAASGQMGPMSQFAVCRLQFAVAGLTVNMTHGSQESTVGRAPITFHVS